MSEQLKKQIGKIARKRRVRGKVFGSSERPRLSVFRSLRGISAQIVDDKDGKTLASVNDSKVKKGTKTERASEVGKLLAEVAKKAGITKVVFDRNGCKFHGRVKALAEAAREGGLKF